MHHLPHFLVTNGYKRKKKKTPKRPKLERMNARKNIDFDLPTTSFSSSSEEASLGLRGTRSLDINPLKSFRIDGSNVDQLEMVFRSLGLESPEDFGIPISSWEARKVRSTSDVLPPSRSNLSGPSVVVQDEFVENQGDVRVNNRGNGIKGVRPPLLSPPASAGDGGDSAWDLLRSVAPRNGYSLAHGLNSSDDEENVRVRLEEIRSCSYTTTSNDDDSSSSTTEPTSIVSPNANGHGFSISANGRFRRITITHWQKGELLGRGSFGSVYEGICDGGFFIAVKEVSLLDQGEQGKQSVYQLEQEIALLSQFEHENIVRYHGTDKDESKLYIFLELITKGSLLSLYRKYRLHDSQVSSYTRQILHGLKYLHDRSVVHRDIKCANILVDANGSVKLADFGLAKATKFNDVRSCKGTAFWMAPEVVNQRNQGYGLAADIWSLGCTVLEMLTGQIPYHPLECMPALFRIGRNIPPPVPDKLSNEARDFILQCLRVNPKDRPTAAQLLDHPFVKRPLPLSDS